jgi:hypothetical protein
VRFSFFLEISKLIIRIIEDRLRLNRLQKGVGLKCSRNHYNFQEFHDPEEFIGH